MLTWLIDELEKVTDFVKCGQGQIRMDLTGTSTLKELAYLQYLQPFRVPPCITLSALSEYNSDLRTS